MWSLLSGSREVYKSVSCVVNTYMQTVVSLCPGHFDWRSLSDIVLFTHPPRILSHFLVG